MADGGKTDMEKGHKWQVPRQQDFPCVRLGKVLYPGEMQKDESHHYGHFSLNCLPFILIPWPCTLLAGWELQGDSNMD